MQKIRTASHLFYLLFKSMCWIIPLITCFIIIFQINELMTFIGLDTKYTFANTIHDLSQQGNFSLQHRLVILLIKTIPLTITVMLFHKLSQLFKLYENNQLFENENIRLIKGIGVCLLLGEFLHLIYEPLMTIALSFNNPAGERFMSFTFGAFNLSMLLTGCIIIIASWITQEAHQLKSDVQLTI